MLDIQLESAGIKKGIVPCAGRGVLGHGEEMDATGDSEPRGEV